LQPLLFMPELIPLLLAAAALYASVGHGGASAYIAIFTLYGLSAAEIRSEVLLMNLLVAGISWWKFSNAGHFSWKLLLPFLPASILMAAVSSWLSFSPSFVSLIAGLALSVAAGWLTFKTFSNAGNPDTLRPFSQYTATCWGAVIGFVSGITGVGGGIFLSPLMALSARYPIKLISGMSAAFIVINSLVALVVGFMKSGELINSLHIPVWCLMLLPLASLAGAHCGSNLKNLKVLRILLALVLFIAAYKLCVKGFS
jgi:uncharacterized membrane protein YfcA